jgi:hypothetical protein
MRKATGSIALGTAFCCVLSCVSFGQNVTPGFQFPGPVNPDDTPTITGADMAGITGVVLKAAGKPDLPASGIHATANSVTFTVPPTASGSYTVVLTPGSIAPIPLTVNPAASSNAPIAPAPTPAPAPPVVHIYMPDGQLKSHTIRVYISPDVLPSQNPNLLLLRSHAVTERAVKETKPYMPGIVAPNQQWNESVGGQQVTHEGTLLLFDLSATDFQLKPMIRVLPVISWTDGGNPKIAANNEEVNVGNIVAVVVWTLVVVAVALAIILGLCGRSSGTPLLLLTGVDGHLSLAQTQIACWTIVIGGVVLGYGLVKLDIPDVPASLLALMGASLATGGIGFFQDAQKQQAAVAQGQAVSRRDLKLGDLLRVFPPDGGPPELSLAKAQMLFWTVLLVVLFISKSISDGAIWDIPWALVALMGFSQAGYLVPKFGSQQSAAAPPAPQPPPGPPPAPQPPLPPQPPQGT